MENSFFDVTNWLKETTSASDSGELSLLVENGQIQIAKIAVSNSVDKSDDIDLHATHFIFVLQIQSKVCSKYLGSIKDAPLKKSGLLKFIYSEKAAKFCEISILLLTGTT